MESILNPQTVHEHWSVKENYCDILTQKICKFACIKYNLKNSMKYLKSCETRYSTKGDVWNPNLKSLQNQKHALLHNTLYVCRIKFI